MKIELAYMVSDDVTGKIIAGFNTAADALAFSRTKDDCKVRITIGGGYHAEARLYGTVEQLQEWAIRRIGYAP